MTDRLYFKGHTYKGLLSSGRNLTGSKTFDTYLQVEDDWDYEMEHDDNEFEWKYHYSTKKEWFYSISEEWKHTLFDRLATEIDVDVAEKIIGEIGIRKVMKKYKESDYYDDDTFPDLSTDLGIRQVFYILLEDTLYIREDYEEITKEEYDLVEDEEDDTDDEEEEENEIVPITDEAFALIGGGVAPCA
jgi:hypothetical protein